MGLLRHIRTRSRIKDSHDDSSASKGAWGIENLSLGGVDVTARLPSTILSRIFVEVCPLTVDDSYNSSEESLLEDGCALCDMKDLAQCALVSRKWYTAARELLYQNIRIEPVHYCEREYELADKRKHKSFFERNADTADAPRERLVLLMRTLRENAALASRVTSLRLPYMTRETCKAEMARTVAVLPHLRYVDVPEGFYSDESSSRTLKHQLQTSCPEIRRMKYAAGAERSLMQLPRHRQWPHLEILELCGLRLSADDLIFALSSFTALQDLKLVDLPWLDDTVFRLGPEEEEEEHQHQHQHQQYRQGQQPSSFPSVKNLTLQNTPQIHADGLVQYLSRSKHRNMLTHLSLSSTGVRVEDLHLILARAQNLKSLSILQAVQESIPSVESSGRVGRPPLASRSLQHLHYEITSAQSPRFGGPPAAVSYYSYLTSSLLAQPPLLPSLTTLYVRDQSFSDTLLRAQPLPPPPSFARPSSSSLSHLQPPPSASSASASTSTSTDPTTAETKPLAVYSRGEDELEWNFTSVSSSVPSAPSSSSPFSSCRAVSSSSQSPSHSHTRSSSSTITTSACSPPPSSSSHQAAFTSASSAAKHGHTRNLSSASTSTPNRPVSVMGADSLSPAWAGGGAATRKSILVNSGQGGFLAVPGSD